MNQIEVGSSCTITVTVTEQMLACHVGSGDVAVYATPMMIAGMEQAAATCPAPFLQEGQTSVGINIHTTHLAATPCGMQVEITALIDAIDGKKVSFTVTAKDQKDLIGQARHDRFIVDKQRFEQKANNK